VGDAKFEKLVRRDSRLSFFNQESQDIEEVSEDVVILMESLQDEAENSKIKLSLLINLSNAVIGMTSIVQRVEVGFIKNQINKIMKILQGSGWESCPSRDKRTQIWWS
jgi:hypothetical protein